MKHYEQLAARYLYRKQEAQIVGKQVRDLTQKRKELNKEVRALRKVLQEMRRHPLTTFFDNFTMAQLDDFINKSMKGEKTDERQ